MDGEGTDDKSDQAPSVSLLRQKDGMGCFPNHREGLERAVIAIGTDRPVWLDEQGRTRRDTTCAQRVPSGVRRVRRRNTGQAAIK